MPDVKALVLSGGGMFGAWQAGAWKILAPHFHPDLVVGASIGSLNGYLIASGFGPEEIIALWRDSQNADLRRLPEFLKRMTQEVKPRLPFAVTITRIPHLRAEIVRNGAVDWRHLAASIAVPAVMPQQKIDGRWYSDGGLLNPLPVWAALELGATEILGLNCLPGFPSAVMTPFVQAFRALFGINPSIPPSVTYRCLLPSERLGGLSSALHWKSENIERWLALGDADARRFLA